MPEMLILRHCIYVVWFSFPGAKIVLNAIRIYRAQFCKKKKINQFIFSSPPICLTFLLRGSSVPYFLIFSSWQPLFIYLHNTNFWRLHFIADNYLLNYLYTQRKALRSIYLCVLDTNIKLDFFFELRKTVHLFSIMHIVQTVTFHLLN